MARRRPNQQPTATGQAQQISAGANSSKPTGVDMARRRPNQQPTATGQAQQISAGANTSDDFALPEPVYVMLGRDNVDARLKHLGFELCQALGLDVEARPSFRKGENTSRVDTIQLSSETACVVVSLGTAAFLPPLLGHLVSCPSVLKFGCGVVDDLKLLKTRFPSTFQSAHASVVNVCAAGCIELGVLAPLTGAVSAAEPQYGLRRLAAHFGLMLDKPKKVQMSDWARVPLSAEQIRYAASDAAVSRWLGARLLRTSQCALLAAAAQPFAGLGGGGQCVATLLRVGVDLESLPADAQLVLAEARRQCAESKLMKAAAKAGGARPGGAVPAAAARPVNTPATKRPFAGQPVQVAKRQDTGERGGHAQAAPAAGNAARKHQAPAPAAKKKQQNQKQQNQARGKPRSNTEKRRRRRSKLQAGAV